MKLLDDLSILRLNHDIECLKYLMKYVKNGKIDSNIYYELVYYQLKFKNWKLQSFECILIENEIDSLLNSLAVFFSSFTENKIRNMIENNFHYLDLDSFDKLKYKYNKYFKGYVGVKKETFKLKFINDCILYFINILFLIFILYCCYIIFYNDIINEFVCFFTMCIFIGILWMALVEFKNLFSDITQINRIDYYYVRGYRSNMYLRDRVPRNLLLLNYEFSSKFEFKGSLYERYVNLAKVELYFIQYSSINIKSIISSNNKGEELCMNLL